jgi:hypothetical protein
VANKNLNSGKKLITLSVVGLMGITFLGYAKEQQLFWFNAEPEANLSEEPSMPLDSPTVNLPYPIYSHGTSDTTNS